MQFRPVQDRDEESLNGQWVVRSAVTDDHGDYVAVTFCPNAMKGVPAEHFHRTFLWSIQNTPDLKGSDEWADRIYLRKSEGTTTSMFKVTTFPNWLTGEGRGNVVSFGRNNTILTPEGIWDILKEEKLRSPPEIYRPSVELHAENTCFGIDRAARINNHTELEILELNGNTIFKRDFPGAQRLFILEFSRPGQKVILSYKDPNDDRGDLGLTQIYLDIGTDTSVELETGAAPPARLSFPRLTKDEKKIVARLPNRDQAPTEIVMWTVEDAGYVAPLQKLFRDFDSRLAFCLSENQQRQKTEVFIVAEDGRLKKRDIDHLWSDEEDSQLRNSRVALQADGTKSALIRNGGRDAYLLTILRTL